MTTRVLTGITPSGTPHLGNYVGAIRPAIAASQASGIESFFFLADLHSLIKAQEPERTQRSTLEIAASWLACGLDAEKVWFYRQSDIPETTELMWFLTAIASKGILNRAHAYKAAVDKNREEQQDEDAGISAGLFMYPVLMAADILLYRATHVPVGDDQKQHLELTRDIAQKFNNDFSGRIAKLGLGVEMMVGEETVHGYFPQTEPIIGGPAARIMSLRDGSKQMSKSDPSDLSRINLTDDADTISKKIRKAKTDPAALPGELDGLAGRPEAENLVGIYAGLAELSKQDVLKEFGGQQFSAFKGALADLAVEKLAPVAGEMRRISGDRAYVDAVLKDGGERAGKLAEATMKDVRDIVGLLQG